MNLQLSFSQLIREKIKNSPHFLINLKFQKIKTDSNIMTKTKINKKQKVSRSLIHLLNSDDTKKETTVKMEKEIDYDSNCSFVTTPPRSKRPKHKNTQTTNMVSSVVSPL